MNKYLIKIAAFEKAALFSPFFKPGASTHTLTKKYLAATGKSAMSPGFAGNQALKVKIGPTFTKKASQYTSQQRTNKMKVPLDRVIGKEGRPPSQRTGFKAKQLLKRIGTNVEHAVGTKENDFLKGTLKLKPNHQLFHDLKKADGPGKARILAHDTRLDKVLGTDKVQRQLHAKHMTSLHGQKILSRFKLGVGAAGIYAGYKGLKKKFGGGDSSASYTDNSQYYVQ